MKKTIQLMAIMLCIVAGMSICSCLGSDDNNKVTTLQPLTQEEKLAQLREMAGFYNGWIYFINDTTSRTDSIPVSWTVTAPDSTITINNFPVQVLANGITDRGVRKVLFNSGTRELTGSIRPYVNEHNKENYYTFLLTPTNYSLAFTTEHEGAQHQVQVNFTYQLAAFTTDYYPVNYFANGEYIKSNFVGFLLVKEVKFDSATFTTGRANYIFGSK